MDPFSIASGAVSVGRSAWKIYEFISSAKSVDKTMQRLQAEVKQVSEVLEVVKSQVTLVPGQHDLLKAMKIQIDACAIPIQTIQGKLGSSTSSNLFKKAFQQAKLDMNEGEVNNCRDQIQRCIQNLQLSLLVVNVQAGYIAPQRADEALISLLDKIQKELDTQGQKIDATMRHCVGLYVSKGTTLYTGSMQGSVIGVEDANKMDVVSGWLNQLQSMKIEEDIRPDTIVGSAADSTGDAEPLSDISDEDHDSDEPLDIELARSALKIGRKTFKEAQYAKAELSFREFLKCFNALPEERRSGYDLEEVELYLAICIFHLYDTSTAKDALMSSVGTVRNLITNMSLKCEAIQCLVIIYARMHRLELAASTCENLYQGQRVHFGKDKRRYKTLAIMAAIYDLQGSSSRADACRAIIPKSERDEHCKNIGNLAPRQNAPIVLPEPDPLDFEEHIAGVAWSHDNKILAVAYGQVVEIRSIENGTVLDTLTFPCRIRHIVLDHQSKRLAVSLDHSWPQWRCLEIWSLYPPQILYELKDSGWGHISKMQFAPNDSEFEVLMKFLDIVQLRHFDLRSGQNQMYRTAKQDPCGDVFYTAYHRVTIRNSYHPSGQTKVTLTLTSLNFPLATTTMKFKGLTPDIISGISLPSGDWSLIHQDSSISIGKDEKMTEHIQPFVSKSFVKRACLAYNKQGTLLSMIYTDSREMMLISAHGTPKTLETYVFGQTRMGFSPNGEYAFYTREVSRKAHQLRIIDVRRELKLPR